MGSGARILFCESIVRFTGQDETLTELLPLMDAMPCYACVMARLLRSVADEPERGNPVTKGSRSHCMPPGVWWWPPEGFKRADARRGDF